MVGLRDLVVPERRARADRSRWRSSAAVASGWGSACSRRSRTGWWRRDPSSVLFDPENPRRDGEPGVGRMRTAPVDRHSPLEGIDCRSTPARSCSSPRSPPCRTVGPALWRDSPRASGPSPRPSRTPWSLDDGDRRPMAGPRRVADRRGARSGGRDRARPPRRHRRRARCPRRRLGQPDDDRSRATAPARCSSPAARSTSPPAVQAPAVRADAARSREVILLADPGRRARPTVSWSSPSFAPYLAAWLGRRGGGPRLMVYGVVNHSQTVPVHGRVPTGPSGPVRR